MSNRASKLVRVLVFQRRFAGAVFWRLASLAARVETRDENRKGGPMTTAGHSRPASKASPATARAGNSDAPRTKTATHPLSIREGTDGRTLLNCHAGCPTQAIVAAMGLTMGRRPFRKALRAPPRQRARRAASSATYVYHNAEGKARFIGRSPHGAQRLLHRIALGRGRYGKASHQWRRADSLPLAGNSGSRELAGENRVRCRGRKRC